MGMPAARAGDMHMCPMVTPGTPPIPHVGGPVLPPGGAHRRDASGARDRHGRMRWAAGRDRLGVVHGAYRRYARRSAG